MICHREHLISVGAGLRAGPNNAAPPEKERSMDSASRNAERKSVRLKNYDYSQAGAYFVTVCTDQRQCFFGVIEDGTMKLNEVGRMIDDAKNNFEQKFSDITFDTFVIMPNHIHAIIFLKGGGLSLSEFVGRFKSFTAMLFRKTAMEKNRFAGKLWQRTFYERVIRNDSELRRVREYVFYNPLKWHLDRNNPVRAGAEAGPYDPLS